MAPEVSRSGSARARYQCRRGDIGSRLDEHGRTSGFAPRDLRPIITFRTAELLGLRGRASSFRCGPLVLQPISLSVEEEFPRGAHHVEKWTLAYEAPRRDGQTPSGYEFGLSQMLDKRIQRTNVVSAREISGNSTYQAPLAKKRSARRQVTEKCLGGNGLHFP